MSDNNSNSDTDSTVSEIEILEMLGELDRMTGNGGGNRAQIEYDIHGRTGHIEFRGVRLEWRTDDEFVMTYATKKTAFHNLNVGPYTVDVKNDDTLHGAGGVSVIHRDNNPYAYEQTDGNYLDGWE